MAKKTAIEYEAMIGGLKRQLDDAENRASNATHQWEQWQARVEKAESKRGRLVTDWEAMWKDQRAALGKLEPIVDLAAKWYLAGDKQPQAQRDLEDALHIYLELT